jgi:regulator of replication initiation timing
MKTDELERAAYAAGDIDRAGLLARIDELQRALGEAVAENESLREEVDYLREVASND